MKKKIISVCVLMSAIASSAASCNFIKADDILYYESSSSDTVDSSLSDSVSDSSPAQQSDIDTNDNNNKDTSNQISDSDSSQTNNNDNPKSSDSNDDSSKMSYGETAVSAKSGQAYLGIVDGQWWIQYWGKTDDEGSMLSYNAGVASIDGDGEYSVSVTADTVGFRKDATGTVNGQYTPGGLNFLAVIINNGEKVCPKAIITINSVKVNDKDVNLSGKAYTSTEDGCIRANIYNPYVMSPSGDARCIDGFLYKNYDTSLPKISDIDSYSPSIVNPDDFNEWTTVKVDFTVSGLD